MRPIRGAALAALLLAISVTAALADAPRGPFPDEKQAVRLLFKHKTPGARRYLAWIRHDHAVRLIHRYHRTKSRADLEAGLQYARSAAELAPDVATFWRVLAMGALSFPEGALTPLIAESALIRVLELEPEDRKSRNMLADLYVGLGQNAEAVSQFEILITTLASEFPDFDTVKMAYACLEADLDGRCRVTLEKVKAQRIALAEARVALAILYRAQHLESKARRELESVTFNAMARQETKAVARRLAAHWKKAGPVRDAPDPEDLP